MRDMASKMTLAAKVYAVVTAKEDMVTVVQEACGQRPEPDRRLGNYEDALRGWGLLFGVAVGLARAEEPCESLGSVASRAFPAACEAFDRYFGEFAERPQHDALVDAVLRGWVHADRRALRHNAPSLADAIVQLGNSIGWPASGPEAMA
jgi:hypothetical protein